MDHMTRLVVALQSADRFSGICAALQACLPQLVPHSWAILVTSAEIGSWSVPSVAAMNVVSNTADAASHVSLAAPYFGASFASAPAHIRSALKPFVGGNGRYAMLPITHDDQTLLCVGGLDRGRWSKRERHILVQCAAILGLALQRLSTATTLQRLARDTQLLEDVRQAIAHTLSLPDLLHQVVEQVARCYGYSLVSLYLLDDDQLVCQHQIGYANIIHSLPVTTGIMARAVRERQSILIEDAPTTPEFVAAIPGIVSEIAVPLQSGTTVYGVLNVEAKQAQPLNRDDLALLEAVGAEVSVAIERAMLYQATARQAQQLAVIERLRSAIASELDIDDLSATIVRTLQDLLNFEFVAVYVLTNDVLHLRANTSSYRQSIKQIPLDQGLNGCCVRKQQPIWAKDLLAEPTYLCGAPYVRSGIYVPLMYRETVLGTLTVESRTALTTNDFEIVTSLSEQLAAALEQGRRFEALAAAQAREAFLNQLLATINEFRAGDWQQMLPEIVQQLGTILAVDRCSITIVNRPWEAQTTVWRAGNDQNAAHVIDRVPLSMIDPESVNGLQQGRSVVVGDVAAANELGDVLRDYVRGYGLRGMILVPVLVDDVLLAVIGVFSVQPVQWQDQDVALLQRVAQHIAVVLRQTGLLAQAERRRHELELVHQVTLDINAHHDLQHVLQTIAERTCTLLNADAATLYLLLPNGEAEVQVGVNIPAQIVGSRTRSDRGMIGKMLATRQSYLVPNYSAWEEHDPDFDFAPFGAALGVPLIANDRAIGTLSVGHIGQQKQFRASDQRLIELLAAQAALAIETAQLLEDLHRRNVEMEAIYANALTLTRQHEPVGVLQNIAERALALLEADHAGVTLLNHATQELELICVINMPSEALGASTPLGTGLAGRVAETRRAMLIHDYRAWAYRRPDAVFAAWGSLLCVPLLIGERVLGTITLSRLAERTPFTEQNQQLLELFASQAVQALEQAQRFTRERMLREDAERSLAEVQVLLQELEQTHEHMSRIEKFRMLGELASEVAHDFNNALVSILGNTQFLLMDESDPERIEMLSAVEAAARDSVEMVKRLQEFSRAQPGPSNEAVDINCLLRDAVIMTQSRWRDITEPTLALGALLPTHGNVTELRRVFMNLIVNALDAMPNGGALHIATRDIHDMVRITVTDTGIGMTPEIQARIFDPFFTTKALGRGTGLGLSICQQIVGRYGGTITVESTFNVGTTFTINLPAARN